MAFVTVKSLQAMRDEDGNPPCEEEVGDFEDMLADLGVEGLEDTPENLCSAVDYDLDVFWYIGAAEWTGALSITSWHYHYLDGKLHGAPAIICSSAGGDRNKLCRIEYREHGMIHRLDGPAVITEGFEEWWVCGHYCGRARRIPTKNDNT